MCIIGNQKTQEAKNEVIHNHKQVTIWCVLSRSHMCLFTTKHPFLCKIIQLEDSRAGIQTQPQSSWRPSFTLLIMSGARLDIKPVNPKGNQPWIFMGRTDAKAEAPVLWPPDAKCQLFGKDPDAEKDWRQKEKETEDEMVGWHHWLSGHEFEQTPGDSEGQGSLECWSPWDQKVWHNLATP